MPPCMRTVKTLHCSAIYFALKRGRPAPITYLYSRFQPAWAKADQPEHYGSVGIDINCAVIGYTNQPPTAMA